MPAIQAMPLCTRQRSELWLYSNVAKVSSYLLGGVPSSHLVQKESSMPHCQMPQHGQPLGALPSIKRRVINRSCCEEVQPLSNLLELYLPHDLSLPATALRDTQVSSLLSLDIY